MNIEDEIREITGADAVWMNDRLDVYGYKATNAEAVKAAAAKAGWTFDYERHDGGGDYARFLQIPAGTSKRSAKSKHVGARTLDGDISAIRRSAGAKGLKSRWGESRKGWIRTRVELSPEAAKMLDKMPRGKRGPFVSAAIIKGGRNV